MIKSRCTYINDFSNTAITVVKVIRYNWDSVSAKAELRNKISGTLYEEPREYKFNNLELKKWRVK